MSVYFLGTCLEIYKFVDINWPSILLKFSFFFLLFASVKLFFFLISFWFILLLTNSDDPLLGIVFFFLVTLLIGSARIIYKRATYPAVSTDKKGKNINNGTRYKFCDTSLTISDTDFSAVVLNYLLRTVFLSFNFFFFIFSVVTE